MARIKASPEQLRELKIKMDHCRDLMSSVRTNANSAISLIESGAQNSSIGNMKSKMSALKQKINTLSDQFDANGQLLELAAARFEETDRGLKGELPEDVTSVSSNTYVDITGKYPVDIKDWSKNAPDSEYARLSGFWSSVSHEDNPTEAFLRRLQELPGDNPLKKLASGQVEIQRNESGFEALVIKGQDTATVIFAGTNGDTNDILADLNLTFGAESGQVTEAKKLVRSLSEQYNNITVTGHSLGGYLATKVTIDNDKVSRCVALDPPGQGGLLAKWFDDGKGYAHQDRITTYVTGGPVDQVGKQVGNVVYVENPIRLGDGFDRALQHNIDDIADAMEGIEGVRNTGGGSGR